MIDVFDEIETMIQQHANDLCAKVKKARRDAYTNLLIRSIDNVTAQGLLADCPSQEEFKIKIDRLFNDCAEAQVPFSNVVFFIFSFVDWARVYNSVLNKAKTNA